MNNEYCIIIKLNKDPQNIFMSTIKADTKEEACIKVLDIMGKSAFCVEIISIEEI